MSHEQKGLIDLRSRTPTIAPPNEMGTPEYDVYFSDLSQPNCDTIAVRRGVDLPNDFDPGLIFKSVDIAKQQTGSNSLISVYIEYDLEQEITPPDSPDFRLVAGEVQSYTSLNDHGSVVVTMMGAEFMASFGDVSACLSAGTESIQLSALVHQEVFHVGELSTGKLTPETYVSSSTDFTAYVSQDSEKRPLDALAQAAKTLYGQDAEIIEGLVFFRRT